MLARYLLATSVTVVLAAIGVVVPRRLVEGNSPTMIDGTVVACLLLSFE